MIDAGSSFSALLPFVCIFCTLMSGKLPVGRASLSTPFPAQSPSIALSYLLRLVGPTPTSAIAFQKFLSAEVKVHPAAAHAYSQSISDLTGELPPT